MALAFLGVLILQQAEVAEHQTPVEADETALPQDTSGSSNPSVAHSRADPLSR